MRIREAEPADAKQLAGLIAEAENSGFMLYEPNERNIDADQLAERIKAMEKDKFSTILLAEKDSDLLGYLFVIGNIPQRTQHTVYLVIGISEKSRGQGVGTELFGKLDKWAGEREIRRLELTVMVQNRAGLALYQKMGFKIEGIKKNSLKTEGVYIDEYYMAKLV